MNVLPHLLVPSDGDPEITARVCGRSLGLPVILKPCSEGGSIGMAVAAQASPELPEVKEDPGALAVRIAGLPGGEKDRLLVLVARDQAARARMELLRGLRGNPDERRVARPRRTVAELLDSAAELRAERCRRAEAEAAAHEVLRQQQRQAARQRRLDELAKNPETAWAEAGNLICTKVPARYDEAVALLADLRELTRRDGQAGEFERRLAALREEHQRKPSLIARFDRAGLSVRDAPSGTRGSR